jgi:hypothetical protein
LGQWRRPETDSRHLSAQALQKNLWLTAGGKGLATHQMIATGIAKMHKMTFQFGSDFEANQRVDTWFERAMENVRNTLASPEPVMVPAHVANRIRARFESRLAALSR